MTNRLPLLALCLLANSFLFSQTNNLQKSTSVNADGSPPDVSAILDVQSTTQGLLVPRMTTSQRTAIPLPANGLLVFDTDTGNFWLFTNSDWAELRPVPTRIADGNGDTRIRTESNPSEDIIRMDLAGSERLVIQRNTPYSRTQLFFPNNGSNLFLGFHAGDSTSTGLQNIFLGENAGRANKTGNANICLGFGAGEFGTGTFNNTFLGNEAGRVNTSGDNTFVGAFAGQDATSGGENTFLGSSAGTNTTEGSFNTFVGRNAGQFNEMGVSNTYLGHGAGALNTAGIGNVFIGLSAGSNEMGNDKLYIENSSATVPLIWGDFSTNQVGINRVAMTNTLEVEGEASKTSGGNWLVNSDARLKTNIRPLDSEEILRKMLALRGITYEWADDVTGSNRPEGTMYGFTAQNIREVFPELVTEDNLGYLQTAYGTYDAMTVEALRALADRIGGLHDEIGNLKIEIVAQQAEMENLQAQLSEMDELKSRMARLEAALLGSTGQAGEED